MSCYYPDCTFEDLSSRKTRWLSQGYWVGPTTWTHAFQLASGWLGAGLTLHTHSSPVWTMYWKTEGRRDFITSHPYVCQLHGERKVLKPTLQAYISSLEYGKNNPRCDYCQSEESISRFLCGGGKMRGGEGCIQKRPPQRKSLGNSVWTFSLKQFIRIHTYLINFSVCMQFFQWT